MSSPADQQAPPAGPLLFESQDQDEVNQFISDTYIGAHSRLGKVRHDARFRALTIVTPEIYGGLIRSTIDYGGTSDPFDHQLFYICVNGQIRVDGITGEQRLRPGDASFFAMGKPLDFDFSDIGFQLLALPTGRVEQIAEEITGIPASQVRFDSNRPLSSTAHRHWSDTFAYIRRTLDRLSASPAAPLLTTELARLLAVTALDTFANTTMTRHHLPGPGQVQPAALRRAVAYIDSHAHQPITVTDIAAAAGTTSRALQYAFRRHRGTTPLNLLRQVRLERAHHELLHADPSRGDTVAAIATRWGFTSPGHFATTYQRTYGQPPSRTLRT